MPNQTIITSGTTTMGETFDVWPAWVESSTSSTCTWTTSGVIWTNWIQAAGTAITTGVTAAGNIWTLWVQGQWVQGQVLQAAQAINMAPTVRAGRAHEHNLDRIVRTEAERAKARERAQKLLQEGLNAQQREQLAQRGFFEVDVRARSGEQRRYRIHRKWSHSIDRLDPSSGRRLETLCIHPLEATPIEDSMLAQKLMLESGMEDDLLRIANHFPALN